MLTVRGISAVRRGGPAARAVVLRPSLSGAVRMLANVACESFGLPAKGISRFKDCNDSVALERTNYCNDIILVLTLIRCLCQLRFEI